MIKALFFVVLTASVASATFAEKISILIERHQVQTNQDQQSAQLQIPRDLTEGM